MRAQCASHHARAPFPNAVTTGSSGLGTCTDRRVRRDQGTREDQWLGNASVANAFGLPG